MYILGLHLVNSVTIREDDGIIRLDLVIPSCTVPTQGMRIEPKGSSSIPCLSTGLTVLRGRVTGRSRDWEN